MSRILRRPMFRGGPVDSYGTGIASGLGTRSGYYRGGGVSYNPFNKTQTQSLVDAFKPRGLPQSFIDFFKANQANQRPTGRFRTTTPGATIEDAEGLLASNTMMTDGSAAGIEDLTFTDDDEFRQNKGEPIYGESGELDKPYVAPGLEAIRQKNIDKIDNSPTVVKTPKGGDDEPEVTMTDLEKALGLDKARQEYAADALAAASAAFFEGKGFGAIADAAKVKSKAPDIKRLAGLEEFKADRAEKLYEKKLDAQARAKAGTIGNLQKDIQFLGTLTGADRIAALGKLGYKAPSLSAAIKELKITGQAPDPATIINLAELYIGPDFEGVVDVTEELSTKPAGTYIANDASALVIIDEQGKPRLQKL